MADEAGPRCHAVAPRARATRAQAGSDVALSPGRRRHGLRATVASRGTGAGPACSGWHFTGTGGTFRLQPGKLPPPHILAPRAWRASPSWVALAPSPRPQWARGRPGSGCPGGCVWVCPCLCVWGGRAWMILADQCRREAVWRVGGRL
jgi:hypothetical protein